MQKLTKMEECLAVGYKQGLMNSKMNHILNTLGNILAKRGC